MEHIVFIFTGANIIQLCHWRGQSLGHNLWFSSQFQTDRSQWWTMSERLKLLRVSRTWKITWMDITLQDDYKKYSSKMIFFETLLSINAHHYWLLNFRLFIVGIAPYLKSKLFLVSPNTNQIKSNQIGH